MTPAHVVGHQNFSGNTSATTRKTVTSHGQDQADQVLGAHSFSAPFAINAKIAKTTIVSSTNSTSCTRDSNRQTGVNGTPDRPGEFPARREKSRPFQHAAARPRDGSHEFITPSLTASKRAGRRRATQVTTDESLTAS